MFYRQNKAFWYQFCNFKHFLKAENSEESLASSWHSKPVAYSRLVRPQLEYASEVWNPSTITEINRIEQIQRAAARFVFADYRKTTHVTPLIEQLDWDQLHTRRLIQQATSTMLPKSSTYLCKTEPPIEICQYKCTNCKCVQVCILPKNCYHMESVATWSCSSHNSISEILSRLCSTGHQEHGTTAWQPHSLDW